MDERLKLFENGDTKTAVWQPGNGTRYEAVATKRGDYQTHWVVAFPLMGSCIEVGEGNYLALGYAQEKMGRNRRGYELSATDLSEMIRLVTMLVPNIDGDVVTDDQGFLK